VQYRFVKFFRGFHIGHVVCSLQVYACMHKINGNVEAYGVQAPYESRDGLRINWNKYIKGNIEIKKCYNIIVEGNKVDGNIEITEYGDLDDEASLNKVRGEIEIKGPYHEDPFPL
jgi:hypothetical protein